MLLLCLRTSSIRKQVVVAAALCSPVVQQRYSGSVGLSNSPTLLSPGVRLAVAGALVRHQRRAASTNGEPPDGAPSSSCESDSTLGGDAAPSPAGSTMSLSRASDANAPAAAAAASPVVGPESSGGGGMTLPQTEAIAAAFRASVKARRMGNFQLRQHIKDLSAADAEAAVRGAKEAGLRIAAESQSVLLHKLMEAGQLERVLSLYQEMLRDKTIPNTETYNLLVQMCCDRQLADSALRLFEDMRKRGRQPNVRTYELAMKAHSLKTPPQWAEAIAIFERLCATRPEHVSERTYIALMEVYSNMTPFDWRIVYNCFLDMKGRRPRLQLSWASHEVLAAAMRKGKAGLFRRGWVYCDTWMHVTPVRSVSFFKGLFLVFVVTSVIKIYGFKMLLSLAGFDNVAAGGSPGGAVAMSPGVGGGGGSLGPVDALWGSSQRM